METKALPSPVMEDGWTPEDLHLGETLLTEYKKKGRRGTEDLGLVVRTFNEKTPSKEVFEEQLEEGRPPCCSIIVKGIGGTENLLLEGVEWGVMVVALEKATARTGKVTGVAANRQARRLYLVGPGLPPNGTPLRLPKYGFSEQLYTLEDALRRSGVPFNLDLSCRPDIEHLQILELIKMKDMPVSIPPCELDTEAITQYVRKYAEARAIVSYEVLKTYVNQMHADGVGLSANGNSWYTADGRKGMVPWVAKEPVESPQPTPTQEATPARTSSPRSVSTAPQSALLPPSLRSGSRSGRSAISGRSRTHQSSRSPSLKSPRQTTARAASRSNSRGSRQPAWRPSGHCSSQHPSETHTRASSSHRSRRVTTHHYDIKDLLHQPSYIVGPSVLHIPAGVTVCVETEHGLKPLRVVMHEGGKVQSQDCAIPTAEPDIFTSSTTCTTFLDV